MSREEFGRLLEETADAQIAGESTRSARPRRNWVPLVAAGAVVAVLAGGTFAVDRLQGPDDNSGSPADTVAGCSELVAPIVESKEFIPFADRRTQSSTLEAGQMLLRGATPVTDGSAAGEAPAEVAGEQLSGLVKSGSTVTAIYGGDAWTKLIQTQDLGDFYRAGGLMLVTFAAEDGQDVGAQTVEEEPDRTTSVLVGDSTGALSWADPIDDSGLRPHVLQWTSNGQNLRLVADEAPEQLVLDARALECSS